MESNEACGESGHMTELSSIKKKKSADTFSDICPAPWEAVGVQMWRCMYPWGSVPSGRAANTCTDDMYKNDDQTQTPPLISHVILSE